MAKKVDKKEYEDILNEVDQEIETAMSTPGGLQKYFDEMDDFITNMPEEEMAETVDTMLYSAVEKMLKWDEEKIKLSLATVPNSVLKEYLKCIRMNDELQIENASKIAVLKDLVKKHELDKTKIPHDINQVNLCGWVTKDSMVYKKNEINYGCKFIIALHWNGRFDIDGKPYASFVDIEYRGKNAVAICPYLLKGKRVAVSGKLAQYRWVGDGITNSRIVVIANDVIFFNDERNLELRLE